MLAGDDDLPVEVKEVPPKLIGTLGELAKVVKPACKITAGLFFKIRISGSEPAVRVVSGPVILILPLLMLPVDSTLSAGPV